MPPQTLPSTSQSVSISWSQNSIIFWDPRRKQRASALRKTILKKITIRLNTHWLHSWMLFPSSWECFPASQPRWDFSGHNSCCCALSNARTHSWEGAVPAPGARPAESPAPPRSRSCRSRRSSPRCCGCSLCFCSPLGLSGEVEGGPLQAHRAFLQTSSQRHPAKKKEENWWPKEPWPQTAHSGLLNTSGAGSLCTTSK